jgi:hypothetical protein
MAERILIGVEADNDMESNSKGKELVKVHDSADKFKMTALTKGN